MSSEPEFTIFKDPADADNPDYLSVKIELPEICSKKDIMLDVGEDRLICEAISLNHKYMLDIFLPYRLDEEECAAQFCKESSVLSIKIPVLS